MELLQEVATIAGKSGLFRILKPGRAGVIVESIDAAKKKEMIPAAAKVSVLKEISVYTTDFNTSKPLHEIFMTMKEQFSGKTDLDVKSASNTDLFKFFEKVMPDFDKERVYAADIKKIVSWYNVLITELPEAFVPASE